MSVTLKDIAERTGVSPSVVSTVLSGRDNGTFVSDSTRQKVLQVAELMNYTPVRSGRPRGSRRLRRQREERFIGVWDPASGPASANMLLHLQRALHVQMAAVGSSSDDDFGLRLLAPEDLPRLDLLGITGIILLCSQFLPREAAAAGIPCVMIGESDCASKEVAMVHADNAQAGRLLGEHLWDLRHRRLLMLASGAASRAANLRYSAIAELWRERGEDPKLIIPLQYDKLADQREREQIEKGILSIFAADKKPAELPTAIICGSESVAAVALQAAWRAGIDVPEQVSITAFGDTPRYGEDMIPPLTTIREPIAKICETALEYLEKLRDEENGLDQSQRDAAFPCELAIRMSSGPAKASA